MGEFRDFERWYDFIHKMGGHTPKAEITIQKQLAKEWWGKEVKILGELSEEEMNKLNRYTHRLFEWYHREHEKRLSRLPWYQTYRR